MTATFDAGAIESTLTLDRTPFSRGLAAARKQAATFAKKRYEVTIGVKLDDTGFDRDYEKWRTKEQAKTRRKPVKVPVEGDTKAASEAIAALLTKLQALRRDVATVRADADTAPAQRKLDLLSAKLTSLEAKTASPDVDVEGAARMTEQLARLDVELDRLDKRNVRPDVNVDVAGPLAETNALDQALDKVDRKRVAPKFDSVSFSNASLGMQVLLAGAVALSPVLVPTLAGGAAAALGLGAALGVAGGGIGSLFLGLSGVVGAVKAMGAAQNTASQSAGTLASAQTGLASAVRSLGNARASAAEAARAAASRVADAERGLAAAQRDARVAQDALNDARLEARRRLEDLTLSVEGNALAQRRATQDVQDARDALASLGPSAEEVADAVDELSAAQERYNMLVADPSATAGAKQAAQVAIDAARDKLDALQAAEGGTRAEQAAARLAIDEALFRQKELGVQGRRLAKDKQDADRRGIKGSDEVAAAEERIADANRRVADARRDVAQAQVAQAAQARQSAYSVAQAEQAVADAHRQTRTAALGAAGGTDQLREALAKLTPEGRRFALFIFGLRGYITTLQHTAERGLLPGLEDGIRAMLPLFPYLNTFVRVTSRAFGTLFREAGQALNAPFWRGFFAFINRTAGPNTLLFGRILGNLARAAAGLMIAFEPFGRELLTWLEGATGRFADWSAELGQSEGFKSFMSFVRTNGPLVAGLLVSIARAAIQIGIALAPYAAPILEFLTGLFDKIADADPATIRAIGLAVLGLFAAFKGAQAVGGGIAAIQGIATFGATLGAAGPWLLLAGAIAGVTLGVIALSGEWGNFTAWLKRVWDGIKAYVTPGLNEIKNTFQQTLLPALREFVPAVKPILNVVLHSLVPGLKFGWDMIVTIITTAMRLVAGVLKLFTGIFTGDWRKALSGLGDITSAVFSFIGQTIWNIVRFVARLFGVNLPSWKKAWGAAWTWIRDRLSAIGNGIVGVLRGIRNWFTVTLPNALASLRRWWSERWGAIGDRIRAVWRAHVSPVLNAFRSGVDRLKTTMANLATGATNAWKKIQDTAKKPVRFVLDTVINKGIIKGYNWLADALPGIGRMKTVTIPKGLRAGGILPGTSRYRDGDDQWVPMRRGEGVYVSEAMRDPYERARLHAVNAAAIRGQSLAGFRGFAGGGINERATSANQQLIAFGRLLRKGGWRVGEHPSFGGVAPVHTSGSWHYRGGAIDVNWLPGQSAAEMAKIDALVASGLPRKYGLRTIWRYPGHFNHAHFDIGGGGDLGNFSGKTGGGGGLLGLLTGAAGKAMDMFSGLKGKLTDGLKGTGGFGTKLVGGLARKAINSAIDWVQSKATFGLLGGQDTGEGPGAGYKGSGSLRGQGQAWAAKRGITGAAWRALDYIITHESSWNINAQNPTSSAHGLGQFINSTARAYNYGRTLNSQLSAVMRYTRDRYGGLLGAYRFWRSHNYYDSGGIAKGGPQLMEKLTARPERVLSPDQTLAFERLVDALDRGASAGGDTVHMTQVAAPGLSSTDDLERLWRKYEARKRLNRKR